MFDNWLTDLVTVIFGILVYYKVLQIFQEKILKYPPGPFRWPLIGSLIQIYLADPDYPYRALHKLSKKYGDILFMRTGISNLVAIHGFETAKQVYRRDDWMGKKNYNWQLLRSYGKQQGLISANRIWQPTRRYVVHHLRDFGFGKTNSMESTILAEIEETVAKILEDANKEGGVIHPSSYFAVPGVNVAWSSVSGTRFEHSDPRINEIVILLADFSRTFMLAGGIANAYPFLLDWFPQFCGLGEVKNNCEKIIKFIEGSVAQHRQRGHYKTNPENFIDAYLQSIDGVQDPQNEEVLTEENLVTVLFDLLWAASDTTSSTFEFAIFWLMLNPSVQTKMREEILQVVGSNRRPTLSDRIKMNYCRATLLEIHRRSAVVPLGPRCVMKELEINGYTIPAQTTAVINMYSIMMDQDFWGDPENFRPERFLTPDNSIDKEKAERIIVFSMGKRNCIGESIAETMLFLVLTSLLQTFEFLPSEKTYDIKPVNGVVTAPKHYRVRVNVINT